MPSWPRIEWVSVARLVLCSMVLCLACDEAPHGADGALSPQRLEPLALLATDPGQWNPTGTMASIRAWHTATLLPSGKVLVSGDSGSAEVYDPATGQWSPTGPLADARQYHTATLLPSGKVLVSGGRGSSGGYLSSAEVYDPATGQWSPTGPLADARSRHTATLLPSGKVLVSGGQNSSGSLSSAEVYDPATGQWSPTGSLASARENHTATLLPSGKVLVSGGSNSSGSLSSAEVYDPATGQWSPTGSLASARENHTATLLPSGKLLVSGGQNSSGSLSSAEVYDPATGQWSPTGPLASARENHTATLLPSGKVLVSGGYSSSRSLSSAEVYDPATGGWSPTGALASARYGHTATLLPSGKVLVSGGYGSNSTVLSSAEVYDPATGQWSPTGSLASARQYHTATLLPSGKVLISEGHNYSSGFLSSAEVYDPATGQWSPTGSLASACFGHTATLLPSGKLLVSGGSNSSGYLSSAEVYDPATGALQEWLPVITPPGAQHTGELFPITGSRMLGLSEASSGNTQNSATNFPLVSLLALEGGALTRTSDLLSFSDTQVTVRTPLVRNGFYILSVITNGLHGGQLVRVDGQPPAAPELTLPLALVNTSTPVIGGTAMPDSTLTVWLDDAVVGTTRANAQGQWSLTPGTALAEGLHRGRATVTDAIGNISPASEEHPFTVDTVPPNAPVLTAPGDYVNTQQPLFAGTAEPHCTVQVSLRDIGVTLGTAEANEAGAWSLSPFVALLDASYQVQATATDPAGNRSAASAVRAFTVDTKPPHAPELTAPDSLVTTHTPVIRGSAEAGSTVTVSLDGSVIRTLVADPAGTWSTPPSTELSDGLHQARAIATDNAGNVSAPSEVRAFTVDTTAPDAPEVTEPGAFANTRTPVIRGTAEANSTVTVWLEDDASQAETVRADSTGAWLFTPRSALDFGSHSVSAYATDEAGNRSPTSLHRFSLQRSHYGFSCSSGPASPAAWLLLLLAGSLARRADARRRGTVG